VADDELKRKRFKRIPTRSPVIILSPPPFAPTHTHTSTTYYTGEKKNETKKELKFDQSISKLQDIHKHEICHFLNSIILKMKKKKFVEL
jgi:hypothetical protein